MGRPVDYDAELIRYSEALHRAWDIEPGDRVLDVGCGAGQTTRDAARLAASALGVDISPGAVDRARAQTTGVDNVAFECADAQVYGFEPGSFDVVISRFGTMFFQDPVAAFTNIGRALRPGGRLVMVVWQAGDRNEWRVTIQRAIGSGDANGPDAFSLGDPATVDKLLRAAGFTDVELTDLDEPVYYGPDVDAAVEWVRGFACTSAALQGADPGAALARLRDAIAGHASGDGVWFGARAWLVTARR